VEAPLDLESVHVWITTLHKIVQYAPKHVFPGLIFSQPIYFFFKDIGNLLKIQVTILVDLQKNPNNSADEHKDLLLHEEGVEFLLEAYVLL
jgi:F420-0:gamma-glutamyl ligase-like protein